MPRILPLLTAIAAVSPTLPSQSPILVPAAAVGADLAESTRSPFARNPAERVLYVYDASHFAGIAVPILIDRIRIRADGAPATWSGDSQQANVSLDMSTATLDHLQASETFDVNHGADRTQVYNGPLSLSGGSTPGGAPGPFAVDMVLASPFVYYPAAGKDLVLDFVSAGLATSANVHLFDASKVPAVAQATSIQSLNPVSPTGGKEAAALALELSYTVASGLIPAFSVDVNEGPTPLTVTFTDLSYSSDPGGITGWSWDFDNDGNPDSSAQSPQHTYTTCGDQTVSLTVMDATGSATVTEVNLIRTDGMTADFTVDARNGPAGFTANFTDTSAGLPQAWSWDLDGDGTPDSALQNPSFTYAVGGAYTVSLTVTRNCQSATETKTNYIVASQGLTTLFLGNNGIDPPGGVFFDVQVTNPVGLQVTSLEQHINETVGIPFTLDVYLTSGSYVGKDDVPGAWRKVATGSGASNGLNNRTFVDVSDFFLPPGDYGMAIYSPDASQRYTNGNGTNQTYSDGNLTIQLGAARDGFFAGSQFSPRVWNGSIFYTTTVGNVYGFFGEGCPHSLGVSPLQMAAGSELRLGMPFSVEVTNLPPAATFVFLTLGFNNTSWNGLPLPVNLGFLGMVGCTGRAEPFSTEPLLVVGGVATWSPVVPTNPVFGGQTIYNQVLIIDPATPAPNTLGAVMSDAAAGAIGF